MKTFKVLKQTDSCCTTVKGIEVPEAFKKNRSLTNAELLILLFITTNNFYVNGGYLGRRQ